jgi:inosine-uridine nucleoside N-ribohydrolase
MTGIKLNDSSDGIYDDGEWISWDYINQQIYAQERQAEFPAANPEVLELFDDLLNVAIRYKQVTGRYLPYLVSWVSCMQR